jgi:hypothetical protein
MWCAGKGSITGGVRICKCTQEVRQRTSRGLTRTVGHFCQLPAGGQVGSASRFDRLNELWVDWMWGSGNRPTQLTLILEGWQDCQR